MDSSASTFVGDGSRVRVRSLGEVPGERPRFGGVEEAARPAGRELEKVGALLPMLNPILGRFLLGPMSGTRASPQLGLAWTMACHANRASMRADQPT